MGCETDALSAEWKRDVTAAHEEAVDGGRRMMMFVFPCGGVEESNVVGSDVGGKGREKGIEIDVEGAVWSEGVVACAAYVVENRGRGCRGSDEDKGAK